MSVFTSPVSVSAAVLFIFWIVVHPESLRWLSWCRFNSESVTDWVSTGFSQHSMRRHINQCLFGDETAVLVLCVLHWWYVVYGDRSGSAVGADPLHLIFIHPGQLEAVLRGRVWVGDAARHRADAHWGQRQAALNCGLWHLWTRLWASAGSEEPGFTSPPEQEKRKSWSFQLWQLE